MNLYLREKELERFGHSVICQSPKGKLIMVDVSRESIGIVINNQTMRKAKKK